MAGERSDLAGGAGGLGPQREDLSGKEKEVNEQGALTYRGRRGDTSRQEKKVTSQGALMSWGTQREGPVRKGKESERRRDTHRLEVAGGTHRGTEKKATHEGGDH